MTNTINDIVKREVNELTTDEVLDAFYQLEALTETIEQYKFKLLPLMRKYYEDTGEKTIENDYIRITYKKAYPARRFQTAKFKADNPTMYDKYLNTEMIKESVVTKIK